MAVAKKTVEEAVDIVPAAVEEAPDAYVRLLFIGAAPKVVVPYGELTVGEVVGAPKEKVDSLLACGLFEKYSGAAPEVIRHP